VALDGPMFRVDPSSLRRYVALFLIAAGVTGCLGRLIADKGMSYADRVECDALVRAVKNRFESNWPTLGSLLNWTA
jgi:hypothetical protein